MKLKKGTHISAGRNCCAKTVYTGDVIHVTYQHDTVAVSTSFEAAEIDKDRITHAQDPAEPRTERLRDFVDGLGAVDDGHARQVRFTASEDAALTVHARS